jgi:hypothetical protein
MRVFVGIPTLSGSMPIDLIQGLHDAMTETGHSIVLHYERGSTPVDLARNKICGEFLRTKCDVLWMIDDDTLPPHNLGDLLGVDGDIVSPLIVGAQPLADGKLGLFNVAYMKNPKGDWRTMDWEVRGTGVIDIDSAGTGCLMIRRHVLEDPRMLLPGEYVDIFGELRVLEDTDPPALFEIRRKPNGEWMCGEDLSFCDRAKSLGYSIKLHTGVVCGHLKQIDLKSLLLDNAKTEAILCSGSSS